MSVSVQTFPVSSTAPNSKVTKRYRNNNNSSAVVPEQKGRKPPRHVVQLLKEVIINKRETASRNAAAAEAAKLAAASAAATGAGGIVPPGAPRPPLPNQQKGLVPPGPAYQPRPRLPPNLSLPPRLQPPSAFPPRLPLVQPSPTKTQTGPIVPRGDVSPRSDISLPPTPSPVSLPSPTTPSTPAPSTPSLLSPLSDSGSSSAWSPLFNGAATGLNGSKQLDTDTINFIHRIYCRECRMEAERKAAQEAGGPGDEVQGVPPTSPMWQVEEASLAMSMDTNKESLKRKLMLRRSANELVDQGILPPLKTPPAYAEQRKQLEFAKVGDQIKHKIQHRPPRTSLVQQHILEDTSPLVDYSLQAKQRQLKRARLQDSLSDALANRPGPLDLVKNKILQIDSNLEDGELSFQSPDSKSDVLFDDDSNSASEGEPSPGQLLASLDFGSGTDFSQFLQSNSVGGDGDLLGAGIPAPPDITPLLEKMAQGHNVPISSRSFIFTKQTVPSITSQSFTSSSMASGGLSYTGTTSSAGGSSSGKSSGLGNTNKMNRIKKAKPKSSASKSKVIKFHEYKGPPNVVKSQQVPSSTSQQAGAPVTAAPLDQAGVSQCSETPHHRRMLQQQLFLQLELQLQHQNKDLPIIIPTATGGNQPLSGSGSEASVVSGLMPTSGTQGPTPPGSVGPTPPGSVGAPTPTPPPPPPPPLPRPLSMPATSLTLGSNGGLMTSFMITTAASNMGTATLTTASAGSNQVSSTQVSTQNGPKLKTMEDFKVAELKAECKKRGLTVSGPKPVLIEKLKNFQEEILSAANAGIRANTTAGVGRPETSVTSPSNLQTISGVINIQPITPQSIPPPSVSSVDESSVSMTLGSPPVSPTNTLDSELNTSHASILSGPLSPPDYSMDIASPPMLQGYQMPSLKSELSGSHSNIPMTVDNQSQSRPPSVAPMDIDLGGSIGNLAMAVSAQTALQSVAPLAPPPPPPPPPLPVSRPASVLSQHTPASPQLLTAVSPQQASQSTTPVSLAQVMSPPQLHGQPQLGQTKLVAPQALQLHGSHSSGNIAHSLQPAGLKLSQSFPQLQGTVPTSSGNTLQQASQNLLASQAQLVHSLAQSQTQTMAQSVAQSQALQAQTNMIQQQLQQLQQNQQQTIAATQGDHQQVVMLQQIKSEPSLIAANKSPITVNSSPVQPAVMMEGQPALMTQEHILKQQQGQIDQLKMQLELSQKQLKEAQDQAQRQQDELKKTLAQAQTAHMNLVKMASENKMGTLMQVPQLGLGQVVPQQATVTGQQQIVQPAVQAPVQMPTSILKPQQTVPSSEPPQLQPVQQIQPQQHSQPPQLKQQQQPAQPQKQPVTSVVAPQASAAPVNRTAQKKQPVLAHIQIQPINSANSQPGATHSISITPSTGTTTISEETKAQILNDLINSKVLQQTLNLPGGMPKMLQLTATGGPNSHSYILTAAPSPPPPGAVCTTPAVTGVSPLTGTSVGSRANLPMSISSSAASLTTSTVTTTVSSMLATTSSSQRSQVGKAAKNNRGKKKDKEQKNKLKVKQNNQINATPSGKPLSNNTLPINGIDPSRAPSLPTSPVAINKLQQSATNPFFSNNSQPSKDPPKYDEAIKNRQNALSSDSSSASVGSPGVPSPASLKSEAMDDVLEILIRTGELPPSAAQEPPPTPKTCASSSISASSFQPQMTNVSAPGLMSSSPGDDPFSLSPVFSATNSVGSQNLASSVSSVGSPQSIASPGGAVATSKTLDMPAPLTISTSLPHAGHLPTFCNTFSPSTLTDTNLSDPLPGNLPDLPFISMEWSDSDTNMNTFDLPDMLDSANTFSLQDKASSSKDFLGLPGTSGISAVQGSAGGTTGSVHGSEPNISSLGLSDLGDPASMNMDVSDWLDVMIPTTGLTPLSANAPVSFTADPILTPKPQDVLDLFNMDESDLYTSSDLSLDNPFEKPMELSSTRT